MKRLMMLAALTMATTLGTAADNSAEAQWGNRGRSGFSISVGRSYGYSPSRFNYGSYGGYYSPRRSFGYSSYSAPRYYRSSNFGVGNYYGGRSYYGGGRSYGRSCR